MNDTTIDINSAPVATVHDSHANAWVQTVRIPTYKTGSPCPYPMFLERRVYQGSSGEVYPLPITEAISETSEPVEYEAVFLENEFLKIMVLPELGGRIHMGYDKRIDYHFVYFNRVIKPALVGLVGPWIAGGIEFNWPQHHRPSTYMPVEYQIDVDGSERAAVALHEVDRMRGLEIHTHISLEAHDARVRIDGSVSNPTDSHQTFLWWANPAVAVNREYQALFPPDVQAVFDHGKRDVSRFPIATGTYYKIDYSDGVDISWYKNIPVPTSYMAYYSQYDFVGGYDHARDAGILHAAPHHVSPGKKMWTWGTGDFAAAWERNLTDGDGPYVELMTGVFSENQPDFTWIAPAETLSFTQYFFPFAQMSGLQCANELAALGTTERNGHTYVTVYAPVALTASLRIYGRDCLQNLEAKHIEPHTIAEWELPESCRCFEGIEVFSNRDLVLRYEVPESSITDIPNPATAPPAPEDTSGADALYRIGLHLEQYRHATISPDVYYAEAVKRDPDHADSHIALARRHLSANRPAKALQHALRAVDTVTQWNSNPPTGWPHYYLGLCHRMNGQLSEARMAFEKARWCADARAASLKQLEYLTSRVMETSGDAPTFLLPSSARRSIRAAWNRIEYLCNLGKARNYAEIVRQVGAWAASSEIDDPMPWYFAAWAEYARSGSDEHIAQWLQTAESAASEWVFPVRATELVALEFAVGSETSCPMAHYYLGNAEYNRQNYRRAFELWSVTAHQRPEFPGAHRNRAIYLFNKAKRHSEAQDAMAEALARAPDDARMRAEHDELSRRCGVDPSVRRKTLEAGSSLIDQRDDLTLQYAAIATSEDRPLDARACFETHRFTPWEGSEGVVPAEYRRAIVRQAIHLIAEKAYDQASHILESARYYPSTLSEGKLPFTPDNELDWWIGICKASQGHWDDAQPYFESASTGDYTPSLSMYYNDVPARAILYQGLAASALGDGKSARKRFFALRDYGERHLHDHIEQDYFAVSFPELVTFEIDLDQRHTGFCMLVRGLGWIGLGEYEKACDILSDLLEQDPNNVDAIDHLYLLREHRGLLKP